MKRAFFALVLLVLLVAVFWLARRTHQLPTTEYPAGAETTQVPQVTALAVPTPQSGTQPGALLGEAILRDYANTNFPPENDLTLMSRLMENSLLLLKSAANRPLSANEDWADLFRGQNAAGERFLPDQHVALNPNGQLVDRWKTPLFFHALGGGRYEIRSAGPDGRLWTDDDLHRNADGSFRRGPHLNPDSLLPSERPE